MSIEDRTYWQLNIVDGGYKLDKVAFETVIRCLNNGTKHCTVIDIHGTEVGIVLKYITDWHYSSPELRTRALKFVNEINVDEGKAAEVKKNEWE